MLGWLQRWMSRPGARPAVQEPSAPPFRWPDEVNQIRTPAEAAATLRRERVVVFISVEWSGQERMSRRTFAEFIGKIAREHPELRVCFGVITESSEGIDSWWQALSLPASAATGYGAVVWLHQGEMAALVPNAAECGSDGLVSRTLQVWREAE